MLERLEGEPRCDKVSHLPDFHDLPYMIKRMNAPIGQTRYKRRIVLVTIPCVRPSFPELTRMLTILVKYIENTAIFYSQLTSTS